MPDYKIESDLTDIYLGREVHFTLNPTVKNLSCIWHFEGGIPEQSNENQPVVTYNREGTFAVWVEIHTNGNVTMVREDDYMHVLFNPYTLFSFYELKADKTDIKATDHVQLEALVQGDSVIYEWSKDFGNIVGTGAKVEFFICEKFKSFKGDISIICKAHNEHGSRERCITLHVN
jgi:hypothetical protein